MLSGFEGVRYGLTVPKKASKPGIQKNLSAFGDDDDSGDEKKAVGKNIERQAQRKLSDQKVAKLQAAALSEDPSIFDYDSHYDTLQNQREAAKPAAAQARKSRYIESLLDKNKERQREQDIIYERKLLRERKAEDHLFGDKDRFVTAAYKKKLEEDKKWLEEEAIRDKKEAEEDVKKRGHMGDFYRNLLSNNVAFGTAKSKEGDAKAQREAEEEAENKKPSAPAQPSDPKWEEMRRAREAFEARQAQGHASETTANMDLHPETAPSKKSERQQAGESQAFDQHQNPGEAEKVAPAGVDDSKDKADSKPLLEGLEPPAPSKEDKAAAARERYLARKRKAPS